MEVPGAAQIILHAVECAATAQLPALQRLVHDHPIIFQPELVLRIILTYLPESTPPDSYRELLQGLSIGQVTTSSLAFPPQVARLDRQTSDDEARLRVQKLHLLPLADPRDDKNGIEGFFEHFLIHRARRIDDEVGDLSLVQQFLLPFWKVGSYLHAWIIGYILPLFRLNYEYYPEGGQKCSVSDFERLDGRAAIELLMGNAVSATGEHVYEMGRDLRGLLGPWISGSSAIKRRIDASYNGWDSVNEWMLDLASKDFSRAVDALDQWDGPGDIDFGDLALGIEGRTLEGLSQEETAKHSRRYAQTGLAVIYLLEDISPEVLAGSHRVLRKVALLTGTPKPADIRARTLNNGDPIPAEFLDSLSRANLLPNSLLDRTNSFTFPCQHAITLAWLLLSSCDSMSRLNHPMSCRALAVLSLFDNGGSQMAFLRKILCNVQVNAGDDGRWLDITTRILDLSDLNREEDHSDNYNGDCAIGPFCQVPVVEREKELLGGMLRTGCKSCGLKAQQT